MNESHPVIRFESVPIVEGSLHRLEEFRPQLLESVTAETVRELSVLSPSLASQAAQNPYEGLLGEALFSEKQRLRREKPTVFTKNRYKNDKLLWSQVQAALLKSPVERDRGEIMSRVLSHYAEEIGGHFDARIYRLATKMVPWTFSWLLNAASVKRVLPWGMTQSLSSRLRIVGEVPHLQNLSKKGTILLVPTHQSNIDSPLVGYVIYLMSLPPFAYGAGLNLFSNPLLSFFMSGLGSYTVDRKKTSAIYKQVLKNYSVQILERGIHSIFFPGGGRSRSGAIEQKLKLGLMGTALEAQLQNLKQGKPNPNVYVVPMVTSYHSVLEAGSLIDDFLLESGKSRYLSYGDDSWHLQSVLRFFWKFFSSSSGVTVRIGRPMDVFGNLVDENGRSIGPNGTCIDPKAWLTSGGELAPEKQRDQEYTRELGKSLVERFHADNTVLTSHAVAFVLFEALRKLYPDYDLYRFLRMSGSQRVVTLDRFLVEAAKVHSRLRELADRGKVFLSKEFYTTKSEDWVEDGIRHLGLWHDSAVIRKADRAVWSDDLSLLYYYRNRLSGYGLSELLPKERGTSRGIDKKGFLA